MIVALASIGTFALAAAGGGDAVPPPREETWQIVSPGGYLESKIREGLAKGIDPARILQAVRSRWDSFQALGDDLDHELREAEKGAIAGDGRYLLLLEMQRAVDLGLPRESVMEIMRSGIRARSEKRADEALLTAMARFAGVAVGSGMPAGQAVRIARLGLARGYSAEDFRLAHRRIMELRERHGSGYSRLEVGRWMEEGIGRFPACRPMLEYVLERAREQVPPDPAPPHRPD